MHWDRKVSNPFANQSVYFNLVVHILSPLSAGHHILVCQNLGTKSQRKVRTFVMIPHLNGSMTSTVDTVTRLWLAKRRVVVRFPVRTTVQAGSEGHPAYCSMGTGGSSWAVKRPKREVKHPLPPSAEVENEWIYTSTPLLYAFPACNGTTVHFPLTKL